MQMNEIRAMADAHEITADTMLDYERIRAGGWYNMATDYKEVSSRLGVSEDAYWFILAHYEALMKMFDIDRID